MKQTTIRYLSVGASLGAILLSGCAGTVSKVSSEERILNDYSHVAHARARANDKLAQGTLSQEDWRTTMNRIDAAAATLDSSMGAMNREAYREAEVGIAASESILGETVQVQATK
jgi:hypothetical protein